MTPETTGVDDNVERRAQQLLREGYPGADDLDSARRIAQAMLDDSESRVQDPAARNPSDDSVIRRSSRETASDGNAGGMRATHDGE